MEQLQKGTPVLRIFDIYRPQIPFDFENICNFINGVFVLQVRTSPLTLHQHHPRNSDITRYFCFNYFEIKD